jgi:hypothetical protein
MRSTITVVQEVRAPLIPDDAHVMTVLINHPSGALVTRPIAILAVGIRLRD